jgi:transcriptional regulator with XRE-family HTH domain
VKKTDDLPEEYKLILDQIGQGLLNIRKREEKNYVRMAEKIGIDRKTYNLLEQGKLNFQFSTLLQVLDYYKISVYDFFPEIRNLPRRIRMKKINRRRE